MEQHERKVAELMAAGEKIEAIKLLREATGLGLAEAKHAVEHLAEHGTLPRTAPAPPAASAPGLPDEVVTLAREGRTLEAIKLLRGQRSLSLFDAKQLVDAVPRAPGARRSGCGALALFALGMLGMLLAR